MSFWTDVPATYDPSGNLISAAVPAPPVIDPADVRPDIDGVAALESTRTMDRTTGAVTFSFSATTRPTAAPVESLIDTSSADVLSQLPTNIDPIWYGAISRAIALRASWQLEASYYREAASTGVGPASEYQARFVADIQALQSLIPRATHIA